MLDYRADELSRVQQKVAEEEHQRLRILQRIQEYDLLIQQAFQEQENALAQAEINPVQLQTFPNYLWRLKQFRFQEYQALQAQEQKLLKAREVLKQAMIKKKSLELLKDKDYTRYRQKIEKAEEELMAEIALNRAYRQ